MSEERISDSEERRLLAAVSRSIAQTNRGVHPNEALAKAASTEKYGPDFIERMVEMYNTSRTLAHLKQASGPGRAEDFPLADASAVLSRVFAVNSRQDDSRGGETGKAANFMAIPACTLADIPMEKAAAYLPDGSAKVAKVLNSVRDLEQDIVNLKTKKADLELQRDSALQKAATYFRHAGHAPFEDVDARMQSMYGAAGTLAMDVVWGSVRGLHGEKRAAVTEQPKLADMTKEPYCHIDRFIEKSAAMTAMAARIEEKQAELVELKEALRERMGKTCKIANNLTSAILGGVVCQALEGTPADTSDDFGFKSQQKNIAKATDPLHENAIRGIRTESMLQTLMAQDPVISSYDPADVVDAYNELSTMSPISSTHPVILRGYLRRLLESSPNVRGRVLEGHEAGQLADIEKTLRGSRESLNDVLKAVQG